MARRWRSGAAGLTPRSFEMERSAAALLGRTPLTPGAARPSAGMLCNYQILNAYNSIDYYRLCDKVGTAMAAIDLRQERLSKGLRQAEAARRLCVSQPYLAMLERGKRRLTPRIVRRAMRVYRLSPAVLPHSLRDPAKVEPDALVRDLGALGYPGFSYARPLRPKRKNPSDVLLAALAQPDLEARLVEALPWLLLKYSNVDRPWLVQEAKARDIQNRLGFVASLARTLAENANNPGKAEALRNIESDLEASRLAQADTLCHESASEPERRWLESHRDELARHWNVLTDWKPEALRYVSAV